MGHLVKLAGFDFFFFSDSDSDRRPPLTSESLLRFVSLDTRQVNHISRYVYKLPPCRKLPLPLSK